MSKAKQEPLPEPGSLRIERLPVDSLHLDPANVRKHPERNIATITASLARFGQQRPILIDADNIVRAGNGTLTAARALGWEAIDCVRTELRGTEATAYAITDNRSAEQAEWDEPALADTLQALAGEEFDLSSVGFNAEEIDEICGGLGEATIEELPDLTESELHHITISYTLDDEPAIRRFVRQSDNGPLSPQIGKQVLGRIKELASA